MSDDPYQILGVERDATPDEIKRRYRALAKELHPDLNPDRPEVGERFKLVTAAYDILSDDDKRGRYDRGEIDATGQERPQHHHYRDFAEDPAGTHFYTREGFDDAQSMQDFFADLFGGRDGRSRVRARGADVAYSLPIEFLEAAKGAKQRVVVGEGHTIDLTIPAGVRDRQTLRLKGQGMPGFDGGQAGDAYVEVHIRPHALFTRKDNDIHLDVPVTLAEAALGGRIAVPTIDGPVNMTVPKGSNTGSTLRLKGKGIVDPSSKQRGDQYVRLKIVLPKEVDAELEQFLERWSSDHPYDPRRELEAQG